MPFILSGIRQPGELRIGVVSELGDECGRVAWPEEDLDVQGHANGLARGKQRQYGKTGTGARVGNAACAGLGRHVPRAAESVTG